MSKKYVIFNALFNNPQYVISLRPELFTFNIQEAHIYSDTDSLKALKSLNRKYKKKYIIWTRKEIK